VTTRIPNGGRNTTFPTSWENPLNSMRIPNGGPLEVRLVILNYGRMPCLPALQVNEGTLDVSTRRLVVGLPTPVGYSDGGRGGLEADSPMSHRRDCPLGIGPLQPARPTSRRQPPRGPLEYSEALDDERRWRTWLRTRGKWRVRPLPFCGNILHKRPRLEKRPPATARARAPRRGEDCGVSTIWPTALMGRLA